MVISSMVKSNDEIGKVNDKKNLIYIYITDVKTLASAGLVNLVSYLILMRA